MNAVVNLLPTAWRPYAKTLVAVLALVLGVIVLAVPELPNWLVLVVKVLTVLGVHITPNLDVDGDGVPDDVDPPAGPRVESSGSVTSTFYPPEGAP